MMMGFETALLLSQLRVSTEWLVAADSMGFFDESTGWITQHSIWGAVGTAAQCCCKPVVEMYAVLMVNGVCDMEHLDGLSHSVEHPVLIAVALAWA